MPLALPLILQDLQPVYRNEANVSQVSARSMIPFSPQHRLRKKLQKKALQDVITQALAAAKAGVDATKDMVPVFGKAAVHAAQCVGVEDQGAVAGYYKILGLSKYICE